MELFFSFLVLAFTVGSFFVAKRELTSTATLAQKNIAAEAESLKATIEALTLDLEQRADAAAAILSRRIAEATELGVAPKSTEPAKPAAPPVDIVQSTDNGLSEFLRDHGLAETWPPTGERSGADPPYSGNMPSSAIAPVPDSVHSIVETRSEHQPRPNETPITLGGISDVLRPAPIPSHTVAPLDRATAYEKEDLSVDERYRPILRMIAEGVTNPSEIARRTGLGRGEIELFLTLRERNAI